MKRFGHVLILAAVAFTLACSPETDTETAGGDGPEATSGEERVTVAMLPKLKGIPYFNLCEEGARRAAAEENVDLIWDAPLEVNTSKQVQLIDDWLVRGMDVLALASNDPQAIAPSIARAKAQGVPVLTWDTDSPGTERDYFINQVDGRVLGRMMMDIMADELGGEGQFAIITGGLEAENLNFWMKYIKLQHTEQYPEMELVGVWHCDSNRQKAFDVATNLLQSHPDLDGIIGNDSAAFSGACDAVEKMGLQDRVEVTGLSMPSEIRPFVKSGVVDKFLLWDPRMLGYLTVKVAANLARGVEPEPGQLIEGYGEVRFDPEDADALIMAPPTVYTATNIDDFDY